LVISSSSEISYHLFVFLRAHAAFSSIGDRLKIATKGKSRDTIPSIQALINCGDAGSCSGGDSNAANAWVYKNGIPDVTCQQYQAKNMECSAINMCMNCDYGGSPCYGISFLAFLLVILLSSHRDLPQDSNLRVWNRLW
jgi:hypothetical protein